jgi:hypothetical protein
MSLVFSNKSIDKYFRFLTHLDNVSKKRLIEMLKKSLKSEENDFKDADLFGAWDDDRSSDEIIAEIKRF